MLASCCVGSLISDSEQFAKANRIMWRRQFDRSNPPLNATVERDSKRLRCCLNAQAVLGPRRGCAEFGTSALTRQQLLRERCRSFDSKTVCLLTVLETRAARPFFNIRAVIPLEICCEDLS